MNFQFILVLGVLSFSLADIDGPIVELPTGKIRGWQNVTASNNQIYIFQKVPYAAPPVGNLRFQPPQSHEGWADILNATKLDITCYQTSLVPTSPPESEDCLILNIFTPDLPTQNNNVSLPVMFYIHGGGFVRGSSDFYIGDRFVDNGVVLVTINYRLGPLGFLSTGDDVIPGNNGLKDQQFALKWVSSNIHLFGGNPNQITIFGQSAGAASIGYQLLNQANTGLFVGALMESGTFLCPWAFRRNARNIAFATTALINSTFETNKNSQDLLDFLLTVDAAEIDRASEQYKNSTSAGVANIEIITGYQWAPVIEVKNPSAFLTKKMYKLLEAENIIQVPLLMGINSEEALDSNQNRPLLEAHLDEYDEHLNLLVPEDMAITTPELNVAMGTKIRDIYTNGTVLSDHPAAGVKYNTDTSFTRPIIKHATLYSKLAKTYFYEFSFHGSLPPQRTEYDGAQNVSHSDELYYMFCADISRSLPTSCDISWAPERDQITSERFLKLWTNFAKYQNPTPPEVSDLLQNVTWPTVSTVNGDFLYLDIGETVEVKNHPRKETYNNWIDLYDSLDYNDFDTY